MELVGTVIGLTFNEHANGLFVREARESYDVQRGYVAIGAMDDPHTPRLIQRSGLDVLFEGPHDQARWDVRCRHGEIDVELFVFGKSDTGAPESSGGTDQAAAPSSSHPNATDSYALLTRQRRSRAWPFHLGFTPKLGDEAGVALYRAERQAAIAQLARLGWRQKSADTVTTSRAPTEPQPL